MTDFSWAAKLAADFGLLGLMIVAIVIAYRLADKWAIKFLDASIGQVKAMTEQAAAVTALAAGLKEGQTEQRDIYIAVSMLSDRIDRQAKYLETIERTFCERTLCP